MSYWWDNLPEERYWVEIRTVPGIGEEVYSDILNARNQPDAHWALVRTLRAGQVVFHYDADQSRFVGYSTVLADAATVGDTYRAPLVNFHPINEVFGLQRMRDVADELFDIRDRLKAQIRTPLFLPFQFTQDRSQFRMLSNYFAKLPIAIIEAIFGSERAAEFIQGDGSRAEGPADLVPSSAGGYLKPFRPKADTAYRAITTAADTVRSRSHETLVNEASLWLGARGFEVGRNAAIDLGIVEPPVILEAKTVGLSWPLAVRAGVAQLYEYRYFGVGDPVSRLILLVDDEPPEKWLKYLEKDRRIGVMWRVSGGFELSGLAKKIVGRRWARRL